MSMQPIALSRVKNFLAKPYTGNPADDPNDPLDPEEAALIEQTLAVSKSPVIQPIQWPDPDSIEGISEHQRSQLSIAMQGNVGLFSGGPGTGKTHTLAYMIKAVLRQFPWAQIRLMAPTGKAAQRMSQSMDSAGLRLRGSTIHTGLVPTRNGHDQGGWGFAHNETNPLYAHLVVIDESTMIDCGLMANLLAAIADGTLVLFVGDPNQLPPVGKGRPYADMIEAGLPHGHLTEPHRFAGRIARVCQQLLAGDHWEPSGRLDLESDYPENMRHVEASSFSMQLETLSDLLMRIGKRGFTMLDDVQVLCGTNPVREKLNERLQTLLNPGGETIQGNPYRLGDKAICLKNQWIDQDWTEQRKPRENPQHYVANGEIGEVIRIDKTFTTIRINGMNLRFSKDRWKDVSLAYAITVHKFQGSQSPVVIVFAEDSRGADMVVDRAHWYTGISRGSKMSFTLGKRSVIDRQCSRLGIYHRKTLLVEKIKALGIVQSDESESIEGERGEVEEVALDDFSDI